MNAHAPESNFASEVALSVIDGEPRAYDLDIAKRLGFTNPLMIRKLIERHAEALAEFGVISTVEKTSGKKGGRPALEYWLTEPQSLYVAAKSEAEEASAVLVMLINVFMAWRRGHLMGHEVSVTDLDEKVRNAMGGIVKRNTGVVMRDAIEPIVRELEGTKQRLADLERKISASSTCTALDLWRHYGFEPLKTGTFWLGNRLAELDCIPEFGGRELIGGQWRRKFDAAKAHIEMKNGLKLLTERYIAERKGQGALNLKGK